uniref:Uncharacterized protein n=1 Tax=Kwoniella dejecticola CBS 10117 TaxID=1296121 RepID=A0A1A6AHM1_9TREE|nr:uncharacterized protein I303_01336 [Kwoniella dejecticola CBS 10117]OBR89508.1 hypothetical protein I303_01336 [Kwoniella dejecticola CBS 10117]
MFFCTKTLFAVFSLTPLVLSSPVNLEKKQDHKLEPTLPAVEFTNTFPSSKFYTGQTIDLTWTGGDGYYDLYEIYYAQGQGSSRTLGIAEANSQLPIDGPGYQLSPTLPFVNNPQNES